MPADLQDPVSVVVAGLGGYGYHYIKALLDHLSPDRARLSAVVDPNPPVTDLDLRSMAVPVLTDLEDVYRRALPADLVVVASPIQYHVPQSCMALEHGSDVLCEKPLTALVQEADRLVQTARKTGRRVSVGYQWSFSRAIRSLKDDLSAGIYGKPVRAKTLCLWPRDKAYYSRNAWAGRIRDDAGLWVLDSPANNAMAHFLHNLFFLLGDTSDQSDSPVRIQAEAYRAHDIENYDTTACRILTERGVEILFYASHAVPERVEPRFTVECESGQISFGETEAMVVGRDNEGNERRYGSPDDDLQFLKLFEAVEAVVHPKEPMCGPEAARSQTLSINGIQESVRSIQTFEESRIRRDVEKGTVWVDGLAETLLECYRTNRLPKETGRPWARSGQPVDLLGYCSYPNRAAQNSGESS